MSQSLGFEVGDNSLVCKLNKSLYRLRQTPRHWFDRLQSTLRQFGFVSSKCDSLFFVYRNNLRYIFWYMLMI